MNRYIFKIFYQFFVNSKTGVYFKLFEKHLLTIKNILIICNNIKNDLNLYKNEVNYSLRIKMLLFCDKNNYNRIVLNVSYVGII